MVLKSVIMNVRIHLVLLKSKVATVVYAHTGPIGLLKMIVWQNVEKLQIKLGKDHAIPLLIFLCILKVVIRKAEYVMEQLYALHSGENGVLGLYVLKFVFQVLPQEKGNV